MGRAVGGPEQFAANSPSAILNAALERDGPPPESKAPRPTCWQIPLQGDVLAQRIGLQRTPSQRHSGGLVIAKQAANVPKFTVAAARKLPPCVLQSSCSDVTVPWYESAEMYWALQDCGVPAKCLVYNRVGHGDFVVGWSPRPSAGEVHGVADLAPYAADLVAVLEGGGLQ